jgi:hypothetical protein
MKNKKFNFTSSELKFKPTIVENKTDKSFKMTSGEVSQKLTFQEMIATMKQSKE